MLRNKVGRMGKFDQDLAEHDDVVAMILTWQDGWRATAGLVVALKASVHPSMMLSGLEDGEETSFAWSCWGRCKWKNLSVVILVFQYVLGVSSCWHFWLRFR